ncbi:YchJ family protein [Bordetella genomosp. 13]|uniref:YchJ family protein n=1 Tax=Bordetella genomosp. 13 TaxID=463040 RepID=UPI00391F1CE5
MRGRPEQRRHDAAQRPCEMGHRAPAPPASCQNARVKSAPNPLPSACPCGSGRAYPACCGRWHDGPGLLRAPDAESLMRSRYSAFVLDLLDYLRQTWHPDTRPADLSPNPPNLKWLGLQVRRHEKQDDDHAIVEFVARCRQDGRASRLHETSRFVRQDGRWLYVDGDQHT